MNRCSKGSWISRKPRTMTTQNFMFFKMFKVNIAVNVFITQTITKRQLLHPTLYQIPNVINSAISVQCIYVTATYVKLHKTLITEL